MQIYIIGPVQLMEESNVLLDGNTNVFVNAWTASATAVTADLNWLYFGDEEKVEKRRVEQERSRETLARLVIA